MSGLVSEFNRSLKQYPDVILMLILGDLYNLFKDTFSCWKPAITFQLTISNGLDEKSWVFEINRTSLFSL